MEEEIVRYKEGGLYSVVANPPVGDLASVARMMRSSSAPKHGAIDHPGDIL